MAFMAHRIRTPPPEVLTVGMATSTPPGGSHSHGNGRLLNLTLHRTGLRFWQDAAVLPCISEALFEMLAGHFSHKEFGLVVLTSVGSLKKGSLKLAREATRPYHNKQG